MKIHKAILLFSVLLSLLSAQAQTTQTIQGRLFFENSPLPLIQVQLNKSTTTTDTSGFFIFDSLQSLPDTIQFTTLYQGQSISSAWIALPKQAFIELGNILLTTTEEIDEIIIAQTRQHGQEKAAHHDHHDHGIGETNYIGANQDATLSAADDIKKMTSMHVGHDHGDGNELSTRGTPWDWNIVLFDGIRLPITNASGTRAFSLSLLPNTLINYLDISKSARPNLPGDAIGGVMNLISKDESDSLIFKINISGGYNFQAQQPLINGSFILSDKTKNKRFGFILGANAFTRNTSDENLNIQYFGEYSHSIRRYTLGINNATKGTYSGLLGGFFQPTKKLQISYKAIGTINTSNTHFRESRYEYSLSSIVSRQGAANEQTHLYGGKLSIQYQATPKLRFEFIEATYLSRFHYPKFPYNKGDGRNGSLSIDFVRPNTVFRDMIYTDDAGNTYQSDNNGLPIIPNGITPNGNLNRYKYIDGDQPSGTFADAWKQIQPQTPTLNASNFEFEQAFSEMNYSQEIDPIHAILQSTWKTNEKTTISGGISFSRKQGERNISLHHWNQNTLIQNNPIPLSTFEQHHQNGPFLNKLPSTNESNLLPSLANGEINAFISNNSHYLYQTPMTVGNPEYRFFSGSNYSYSENYGQAHAKAIMQISPKLEIEAGIRYEQNQTQITVDTVLYDDDKLFIANVYETGEGVYTLVPVDSDPYQHTLTPIVSNTIGYPIEKLKKQTNYSAFLPSINIKYDLTGKTVLRLSISRSYRRPIFEELKPGQPIINYSQLEYTLGNPNLKPAYSWNFDFTVSSYLPHDQILEFGIFAKRIDQLIFKTVTYDTDPILGIRSKSYQNGTTPAYLLGAEWNFRKRLDFLPGIMEDLGVEINGAAIYSTFQVPGKSFKQSLPNQPSLLTNIQLFFDAHEIGLFVLMGVNFTGNYTTEINTAAVSDGSNSLTLLHANTQDYDQFTRYRWEGSFYGEYSLMKNISLYLAVNNIFNSPHMTFRGNQKRVISSSYDGMTARIGFKLDLIKHKKKP